MDAHAHCSCTLRTTVVKRAQQFFLLFLASLFASARRVRFVLTLVVGRIKREGSFWLVGELTVLKSYWDE